MTLHNLKIGAVQASDLDEFKIDISGSGDATLVAAVANRATKVYRLFLVVGGATTLTFKNGSTALTGAIPMTANGSITLDFEYRPWFTCSPNSAFILNSSNAVQISGRGYYVQS